jgi:hypothetical protein
MSGVGAADRGGLAKVRRRQRGQNPHRDGMDVLLTTAAA